jgi:hypothetical protein
MGGQSHLPMLKIQLNDPEISEAKAQHASQINVQESLDWIKGKSKPETHGFLPSNIGLSCNFSHNPIL